ncbi:MAG: Mannose permease IID component [Syntrophaceae bacterium PtaB.Bin095]|nr:MAG: Mannose permease IID component [Syntrophaceae bacterium PtaB.Bin095]
MRTSCPIRVFLRSLLIHSSFNFWRMQNLGFAYAMLPLIRRKGLNRKDVSGFLVRHLEGFNTHPYLSGPVIGSIARLEETTEGSQAGPICSEVKNTLMGPYAAIGDTFFWGAWRPFSAIVAVLLAREGFILAPVFFLIVYNPPHFWVRCRGFLEGYRRGRDGIGFISAMNLPAAAGKIRWLSLAMLGVLAALAAQSTGHAIGSDPAFVPGALSLTVVLLCFWLLKMGATAILLLYGMAALLTLFSL